MLAILGPGLIFGSDREARLPPDIMLQRFDFRLAQFGELRHAVLAQHALVQHRCDAGAVERHGDAKLGQPGRQGGGKTAADIRAGYDHSVALCMTIAALQSGRRATFDEAKQEIRLA